MTRVRALLAATGLAALVLVPAAEAAPASCGKGGTYEQIGGGWLELKPEFAAGGPEVTAIATPAFLPDTVYATNGRLVVRTEDGGCNWDTVLDAGQPWLSVAGVADPVPGRVTALAAPSSATNSSYVYVSVDSSVGGTPAAPTVFASKDRGDNWTQGQTGEDGLPPVGRIRELVAVNLMGTIAYALIEVPAANGAPTTALFHTSNAGQTWQRRTGATEAFVMHDLVPSPLVPTTLFALGPEGVHVSEDSGATFFAANRPGVVSLAAAVGQGSVRLAAADATQPVVRLSTNAGETWRPVSIAAPAQEVAVAPLRETLAVNDGARVWVHPQGRPGLDITPYGRVPRSLRLSAPTATGVGVTGLADGYVMRTVLNLTTWVPRVELSTKPIRLLPGAVPGEFPPVMLPGHADVPLAPGQTADVPFTLLLPRTPSPVDVMFLVDTTGSMSSVIEGLKVSMAEIVNELGTLGLDARFGIGGFKSIPKPYGHGPETDEPYERYREIGYADEDLQTAIGSIQTGGGDAETAALVAAEQAASGTGFKVDGTLLIPRGQDARYRQGAARLAFIATDIGMKQGGVYPEIAETAAVLRAEDVRAVGLAVAPPARGDQLELAEATGALAPAGGLDCDGNGKIDVVGGDPLVCDLPQDEVSSTGAISTGTPRLAPAVVGFAESVADYRPVTVRAAGDAAYGRVVAGGAHRVNLKADNEVPFTVRFTCPQAPKPSTHEFRFTAGAAGRPGADATATLECGGVAAKPKPRAKRTPGVIDAAPAVPPLAAAAAAPGPPPPNPVPQPQPHLNPNPNPGVNVNVGVADQQQEEFQLAVVEAENSEGTTYAMTGLQPSPAMLLGPAALLMASAGYAARRRTAVRPALVRTQRW